MASSVKDILCRLCGRKSEFSKDLLDENNKSILELILRFTQININKTDKLPTHVCLDCEEKIVAFQLFILECYKVQESLSSIYLENYQIKYEEDTNYGTPVKYEVKDEFTSDNIEAENGDESPMPGLHNGDIEIDNREDDDEDDVLDNITIASLKNLKKKYEETQPETHTKHILKQNNKMTKEEAAEFSKCLQKPYLKIKEVVKMECNICQTQYNSWTGLSNHYFKTHKKKAVAFCMCGFAIRSKSVLYQHITNHKSSLRKSDFKNVLHDNSEKRSIQDFVTFTCFGCEKRCSSWDKLKWHCQRIHNIKAEVRCICGTTLRSKSSLYKHIQDHKNPNELSCDQCALVAKSVSALEKHKMKHIPKEDRKFICDSCDKICTNKDALKSHQKSHIPIEERKIFRCDICDLKFTTSSSASSHKRVVHQKIKSYVCDQCGYACGTNGELRQHRAIHSDEKPFICNTCSKSFKTYSNLKTHMDTHEQTSYACYVCNRVLNSRRTLRKHLLVHEDKCRHVCSYCNKAFKRRQTLKVHMHTHTGDKPLSCKWCDERFSYASTLRSHRLRCHPEKMAAQTHSNFPHYNHVTQQDYLKSNVGVMSVVVTGEVLKNEVETI